MKTTAFGAKYVGRLGVRFARSLTLIAVLAGVVFLAGIGMPGMASADDTGWVGPSVAETGSGVSNPDYALAEDTDYAVFNYDLDWERYGFSSFPTIPAGATITGIEVRFHAHQTDTRQDLDVRLSKDGGSSYVGDTKTTPNFPTSDSTFGYESVGGNGDLWGTSWSPGDFTAANFKVRLYGDDDHTSRELWLDYFEVKVYYSCDIQGPNSGTGSNDDTVGSVAWSTPGNVSALDGSTASVTVPDSGTSNYLKVDNLGLLIPAGATITGIQVDVVRSQSSTSGNSIRDDTVKLVKGGSVVGSNRASYSEWPSSPTNHTYGGSSDLWGETWGASDIDEDFGVVISVENPNDYGSNPSRTAYVDYITVTVFYECPCEVVDEGTEPTTTDVGTSDSPSQYGDSVTFTATVADSGTPTGNVKFVYDGTEEDCSDGTEIDTVALDESSPDRASVSISTLAVGSHTIRACYLGDGTYDPSTNTVDQQVNVKDLTITEAVAHDKVYDGNDTATVTGGTLHGIVDTEDVYIVSYTANFNDKNVGDDKPVTVTAVTLGGADKDNYTVNPLPSGLTADITCKYITVSAHVPDKVYDTTTDIVGTIGFSSSGIIGSDDVVFCYDTVNTKFPSADAGNHHVEVLGINICGGTDENNYCLNNTSDYDWAKITKAPTTTTVYVYDPGTTTAASPIEWMDAVDFHAEVSGCPDDPVSGTVAFEVGSTTYGTVPVDGSNDADLGDIEIANLPTNDYTVTATFVSSNSNCSGSSGTTTLHVDPREADSASALGFYTGDRVAWTPNENSNSASVKLAATIVDNDGGGDITQATVTFLMNGEPIPGAKDLPVGLVDPDDPTVGVAAAIVQFNMSQSSDSETFIVTVEIGGNYTTGQGVTQGQIMLIVPTPGGRILGANATLANENALGYLGTNPIGCIFILCGPANYSFSAFDISYNKSLRNPQGKLSVLLLSVNDQNGEEDRPWYDPHVYLFTSNAITALNVTGNTALFSAKCTVKELVGDNWFAIEGNAKMDVTMTDLNPTYPASYDTLGITVYKKRGGLWFSSNWNGVYTVEQNVFLIKDQLTVQ